MLRIDHCLTVIFKCTLLWDILHLNHLINFCFCFKNRLYVLALKIFIVLKENDLYAANQAFYAIKKSFI